LKRTPGPSLRESAALKAQRLLGAGRVAIRSVSHDLIRGDVRGDSANTTSPGRRRAGPAPAMRSLAVPTSKPCSWSRSNRPRFFSRSGRRRCWFAWDPVPPPPRGVVPDGRRSSPAPSSNVPGERNSRCLDGVGNIGGMNEKRCSRCREIKPLSEFYAHPMHSDGLQSRCKECTKAAAMESQAKARTSSR
jgi:hypothetical protein